MLGVCVHRPELGVELSLFCFQARDDALADERGAFTIEISSTFGQERGGAARPLVQCLVAGQHLATIGGAESGHLRFGGDHPSVEVRQRGPELALFLVEATLIFRGLGQLLLDPPQRPSRNEEFDAV